MFPEGIAMAHAQPLALVAPCSRSAFSARPALRVVSHDDTNRFIPTDKITREQVKDCSTLAEISALDATKYLAEFMGFPGLVKGVQGWGYGMLVFSENLKFFTRVCSSRVNGNKIKFNYGSEEIKEDRANCWEFCVKRVRIDVITKAIRQGAIEYPLELSREDTTCPICLDPLVGNVVKCNENHQTCLKCFNLLPTIGPGQSIKKCVLCNVPGYTIDEYKKIEQMNGSLVKQEPYFYLTLRGGNSSYDFKYNEALFLGMLKVITNGLGFDIFRRMLISSFYNYYMDPNRAFSSYTFNILNQVEGNNRTLKSTDDLNSAITDYINDIDRPEIYNDVKYTDIYMGNYDERDFYRELREIDGNIERIEEYAGEARKNLLKREIYFRFKCKNTNANEFIEYFKNIFYRILNYKNNTIFNYITIEE